MKIRLTLVKYSPPGAGLVLSNDTVDFSVIYRTYRRSRASVIGEADQSAKRTAAVDAVPPIFRSLSVAFFHERVSQQRFNRGEGACQARSNRVTWYMRGQRKRERERGRSTGAVGVQDCSGRF